MNKETKETKEKLKTLAIEKCRQFEKDTGATVVYLTEYGSTLYGLDNENSDTDFKGIFIPSKNSVLLKQDLPHWSYSTGNDKSANSNEDLDLSLQSVYTFFDLLKEGETGVLDVLFSMFRKDTIVYSDDNFVNTIKETYKEMLSRNLHSFVGYSVGQATKYGLKGSRYKELDKFLGLFEDLCYNSDNKLELTFDWLKIVTKDYKYINFVRAPGPKGSGNFDDIDYIEILGKKFSGDIKFEYFLDKVTTMHKKSGNRTVKASEGTDWKALSHAVRVLLEVEELLDTHFITFPLKQAKFIKSVKYPKDEVKTLESTLKFLDERLDVVKEKLENSTLPENSNIEFMNETLLKFIIV